MPKSNKEYWWFCAKCGSDYEAWPGDRIDSDNCPFCAGKQVNHTNSLVKLMPEIAKEWHPTKNGDVTPADVTTSSSKKAWWLCSQGHSWEVAVYVRKRSGCNFEDH